MAIINNRKVIGPEAREALIARYKRPAIISPIKILRKISPALPKEKYIRWKIYSESHS
jgi:hypothetical protein